MTTWAVIGSVLPVLREAEICEGTGYRKGQPTHPERNVQAPDLCLPPKDDPKEMDYPNYEKQCRGDGHIGFSVQLTTFPSDVHINGS